MRYTFTALIILGALVAGFLWFTGPNRENKRTSNINDQMNHLKDRVRANPSDSDALHAMISAVHSKDSFVRTTAIAYLGEVGGAAKPAIPDIVSALNGNDGFDARAAAISLGQIGPVAKDAIPDLIRAVGQYPNSDVGWFSAESLGHIANGNDTNVIDALTRAAMSTNEDMKYSANAGLQALKAVH